MKKSKLFFLIALICISCNQIPDLTGNWVSNVRNNHNRYLTISMDGENYKIHMHDLKGPTRQEEHTLLGKFDDNQIDVGSWPGPLRFSEDFNTIYFHNSTYRRNN